jgi:hypothetical protein
VENIGQQDVRDYADKIFGGMKKAFGYKLGDVDLTLDAGNARLLGKDFTVYISITLNPNDPTEYLLKTEVTEIRNPEVIASEEFNALFAHTFDSLTFQADKGFDLHTLIKSIEAIGDETRISVDYPGDISSCTLKIKGLDASIVVAGSEFRMEFSQNVEVKKLIDAFNAAQKSLSGPGIKMLALNR